MAVEIHYVNVGLFWVDANGNVIHKGANTTKLSDFTKLAVTQEHRVIPNLTGAGASNNSADYPTIKDYLALEAVDNFAFAYMDQTQLITQMVT